MGEAGCDIYLYTASDELCETCRNLGQVSVGEKVQFGDLDDIQNRLPCKLCRIISVAVQNHRRNRPFESPDARRHETLLLVPQSGSPAGQSSHGHLPTGICPLSMRVESTYHMNSPRPICVIHHTHSSSECFQDEKECSTVSHGLQPTNTTSVEPSLDYYCEYGDLLDIRKIRSWLDTCESKHDRCNTFLDGAAHSSTPLLVVDVESMCLVEATSPRYVALSYVWGTSQVFKTLKSDLETLKEPEALQRLAEDVPLLIRDSLLFTRRLGERYLWVDSLCVVQDDESTKLELIQRMDTIYAEAACTIIAHGSLDASSPLSGFRQGTRLPHRVTTSIRLAGGNEGLFICSPSHYASYPSVYDTRAWTFQEQILSRRRLVFSADQVLFSCNWGTEGDWCEDPLTDMGNSATNLGVTRILDASGAAVGILPNLNPNLTGMTDGWKTQQALSLIGRLTSGCGIERDDPMKEVIHMYTAAVTSYSSRKLSFASDILNAFSGILATIERSCGLKPGPSMYGLLRMYPLYSLHWISKTAARRQGWPTWSWAGWESTIYFLEREDPRQLNLYISEAYLLDRGEISTLLTSDKSLRQLQLPHVDGVNTPEPDPSPSSTSPFGTSISGHSSDLRGIPVHRLEKLLNTSMGLPILGFWAQVVAAQPGAPRIRYHPTRQTKVRIWRADNEQCGHMHEEFDWSSATRRPTDEEWDRCQMVYLSHSRRRCVFHIYSSNECAGTCNAVVVDPGETPLGEGCARRVGMAEICGNTWKDVPTTWQFVALT